MFKDLLVIFRWFWCGLDVCLFCLRLIKGVFENKCVYNLIVKVREVRIVILL